MWLVSSMGQSSDPDSQVQCVLFATTTQLPPGALATSNPRFLNLRTTDISGQIILYCGKLSCAW